MFQPVTGHWLRGVSLSLRVNVFGGWGWGGLMCADVSITFPYFGKNYSSWKLNNTLTLIQVHL